MLLRLLVVAGDLGVPGLADASLQLCLRLPRTLSVCVNLYPFSFSGHPSYRAHPSDRIVT